MPLPNGIFCSEEDDPAMRKIWLLTFFSAWLVGICLTGCSRQPAPTLEVAADTPGQPVVVPSSGTSSSPATPASSNASEVAIPATQPLLLPVATPEPSVQEKYDAALLEALNFVAEKKYAEALVSLGTAKAAQNNEQVQREIDNVKGLISQRLAAEQTAQDIRTVIRDGKA